MGVNSTTDFGNLNNSENPETVTDSEVVDFYESCLESVKFCMSEVCLEYNIDDLATAPQNRFEAVLKVVGRRLFKNISEIRRPTTYGSDSHNDIYINNNSVINSSDNNINYGFYYDIDKLYIVLDMYYFLCGIYDKAISIIGFSSFIGMSVAQFYHWKNGDLLTNIHINFAKTLKELRQESLTNILTTAKRNPVGLLGILNHEFNWSMPGVTKEKTIKVAVDASELPSLGNLHKGEELPKTLETSNKLDSIPIKR